MLYKSIKVKVCSADGDTDYFDILAGVPQGDKIPVYHTYLLVSSA